MKDPIETIAAKFRSGNSVPVERAVVLASEWYAITGYMQAWSREKLHEIECLRGEVRSLRRQIEREGGR